MELLVFRIVLLFLFSFNKTSHSSSVSGPNTDQLSLMSFKSHITYDPNDVLSSWDLNLGHYCNWTGVTCGRRHTDRVVGLDLNASALVGSITPAIGNLTFLRRLDLGNNSLTGELPSTLGRCSRLQQLIVWKNKLTGSIPSSLGNCSELQFVNVGVNLIGGMIPSNIGSLTKLKTLSLWRNQLVHEIPSSLGNLSSMTGLYLDSNNLVGQIPSSLGNLNKLIVFTVATNSLSGIIPPSIYNLTNIRFFHVYENKLHGNLPQKIAFFAPNLQRFDMFTNKFSGFIPPSLCNASNLNTLQIGTNNFSGIIPPCIGNLKKLSILSLFKNQFETKTSKDWSFFDALTNCTSLKVIEIQDNNFEGVLPLTISNLSTNLNNLFLGGHDIYGSIPEGVGSLTNLEYLYIVGTNIDGNIPNSIGKLKSLSRLYLHENNLVGNIPNSFYNLTKMNRLYLFDNNLQGEISENIRNMQFLDDVRLSYNNFSASIPKGFFNIKSPLTTLYLSYNNFSGPLSSQVGLLTQLDLLDISNNKLSGMIPTSLGSCQMLTNLQLQNNLFQGMIPESIAQLKTLETLDLSRNDLSGDIPKSLGKLVFLKSLNLSYNNLWGEMPKEGVFTNASSFFFVGNKGLCGGHPSLHLPQCKNFPNAKHRNKNVTMIVLVSVSSLVFVIGFATTLFYCKRKVPPEPPAPSNRTTYAELLKATDGFSSTNWIGAGSFGSVYKGFVESIGKQVAIKVFNLQTSGALRSFVAECEALKNIRHRNLVKIVTACSSLNFEGADFKALIYEFVPNGSLEEWMHPDVNDQSEPKSGLTFDQRLNIAIDMASAIDYLHCGCHNPIVHCDLKPSNVLLGDDMTAYVGDFGLAKILLNCGNELSEVFTNSLAIEGTIGYIPPEYGVGSKVSTQGDVYSYGILLLEMITGRTPTDDTFEETSGLYKFVERSSLPEDLWNIVDPKLIPRVDMEDSNNIKTKNMIMKMENCLVSMIRCGLMCAKEHPRERMTMKDVVRELVTIRQNLSSAGR